MCVSGACLSIILPGGRVIHAKLLALVFIICASNSTAMLKTCCNNSRKYVKTYLFFQNTHNQYNMAPKYPTQKQNKHKHRLFFAH